MNSVVRTLDDKIKNLGLKRSELEDQKHSMLPGDRVMIQQQLNQTIIEEQEHVNALNLIRTYIYTKERPQSMKQYRR